MCWTYGTRHLYVLLDAKEQGTQETGYPKTEVPRCSYTITSVKVVP